jgi:uncharacterized phage protein (TIGR02218 family)
VARTRTAALISHLAGTAHTRCRMLLFILRDGTKYGVTDQNKDIDFSLPEASGTITYSSRSGFAISNVEQASGLEPGNYDVTGPIADVVTLEQLLGGRWRWATTYLFEMNWKDPTAALDIMKGRVESAGPSGGKFKFQILDDRNRYGQTVGYWVQNQCSRDFPQCCVNIAPETETTVASVTSTLEIEVDATITGADFIGGRLWFTDGPLAGNDPVEIFAVTGSTITLFEPLPALPEVGNAVTLKEGCDGIITTCRDRFDNAINFRHGYPAVRGNKILQPAIPGQGNNGG